MDTRNRPNPDPRFRNSGARFACGILLVLLAGASNLPAVATQYAEQNGYFDYVKGRMTGVSLDDKGTLSLSPAFKGLLDFNEMYVWSLAENSRGELFCGTGNNGQVYRIAGTNAAPFFDSGGTELTALAVDTDDSIFAGLSPKGLVYKLSPSGQSSIFATLKSTYVWAMAFDSKRTLYVATGGDAAIWKIDPSGRKELFFSSAETHYINLVLDQNDNCYVAGSQEGLVYRISADREKQVLFDSLGQEITALCVDRNGAVYVATGERSERSGLLLSAGQKPQEGEGPREPGFPGQPQKPLNCVWKLTPDGRSVKLIELADQTFIAMTVDDRNNAYVGCANNGEIYRIAPDETVSKLFNLEAMQVLSLFWSGRSGRLFAGTGNLGNVFTIDPVFSREGSYLSDIFDTKFKSWFGSLTWVAERPEKTDIRFQTRSGNSGVPDDLWSDWSPAMAVPGQHIASPQNRFFQYRLTLVSSNRKSAPKVSGVKFSYRQFNQKPVVQKFDMEFPQSDRKDTTAKNNKLKPQLAPNERRLVWDVTDPNDDQLEYDLYFKPRDATNWLLLTEDADGSAFTFDSQVLPDGFYNFKLVASDRSSNPAADSLSENSVSRLLLIDNQPPEMPELTARRQTDGTVEISGRTADALSDIRSVEYSFDAADWIFVLTEDGIYDSSTEKFSFRLKPDRQTSNFVILKVTDGNNNYRTFKLGF